ADGRAGPGAQGENDRAEIEVLQRNEGQRPDHVRIDRRVLGYRRGRRGKTGQQGDQQQQWRSYGGGHRCASPPLKRASVSTEMVDFPSTMIGEPAKKKGRRKIRRPPPRDAAAMPLRQAITDSRR